MISLVYWQQWRFLVFSPDFTHNWEFSCFYSEVNEKIAVACLNTSILAVLPWDLASVDLRTRIIIYSRTIIYYTYSTRIFLCSVVTTMLTRISHLTRRCYLMGNWILSHLWNMRHDASISNPLYDQTKICSGSAQGGKEMALRTKLTHYCHRITTIEDLSLTNPLIAVV